MSRQLIESIVSNNMLEANDMVEAKLAEIRERKLHEMKRMFAAQMDEALGAMSKKDREARADWPRASDPVEKGGLGLSSYDVAQEKLKARLSKRESSKAKKHKVAESSMGDRMSGKEEDDKFEGMEPKPLKKDPRLRTMDRFRKNLERYDTLKAKGSTTADARLAKIAKGYAGKLAKNTAKTFAVGTVNAVKRVAKAPVVQDLKNIGFRNL